MNNLAVAGAALLGGSLTSARKLHGGDLSTLLHITLADGRDAVIKTGPACKTEAAMLRAIAASGAPAPAVLAVDDHVLALQFIRAETGPQTAWRSLGETLATLHRTTAADYGWPEDYAFAQVKLENSGCGTWPDFTAERRLMPHAPHIPAHLATRLERLARDIHARLPRHPRAALLHGDLWSGNILAAAGRIAAFIDPACIFGHTEIDLAMLSLFATPTPAFHAAYGPGEPGAEARLPIYQLHPAFVHLRLFGAAYLPMVENLLAATGV